MRVAERGKHSAEVCGNVLHNEHEGVFVFSARRFERVISERQKGYQSHIVCHNHRAEIGDKYERERYRAEIFEFHDDFSCKKFKEAYSCQTFDHGERAEQAIKRGQVEISEIFFVGRNYERRNDRGDNRHA